MADPVDSLVRPSLAVRLGEKLPEILIEAASVVVALLLALAINNWSERQQELDRAALARTAILAELHENQEELRSARPQLDAVLERLRAAAKVKDAQMHELAIELNIALLSSAAWHASTATRASQNMELGWLTRMAKVYELQDNFLRVQNLAIDQLGSIPADGKLGARDVAQSMIPRLNALSQIADGLTRTYDEALGEGGG
jgi:hypothetical protein